MKIAAEVDVRREVAGDLSSVFDAFISPELISQWMFGSSLNGDDIIHIEADPREGGRFSFLVSRDGQRLDHVGTYLALERPKHLRFTWAIAGQSDDEEGGSLVDVTFSASPGGTEVKLAHGLQAEWAPYAHQVGESWSEMLDALANLFAGR